MIDRRGFGLTVGAGALAMAGFGVHRLAAAQGKAREGKDFLKLHTEVPVDAPAGKIEVIEFFWYSCPHCNAFEPQLEAWLKKLPKDVAFKRVPVQFRPNFIPQQKLFYTLEALGKVDELHLKVFNTVHIDKNPLDTDAAIAAWAEKNGLNKAKFTEAYNSFAVSTKVAKAAKLQQAYELQGVPSFGIAGKYYTDATVTGSMDNTLAAVEKLIAEQRTAGK